MQMRCLLYVRAMTIATVKNIHVKTGDDYGKIQQWVTQTIYQRTKRT
jgi:hypothetical protein